MNRDYVNLIADIRSHIKELNTSTDKIEEVRSEILVPPAPDHNEEHKSSLDFQVLERRQKQIQKKYKRPPGWSDAREANVLDELEEQSKNRFKQSWKILPKGLKLNRLQVYLKYQAKKYRWSASDLQQANNLVKYKLELTTHRDIVYDEKKGHVTNIKALKYTKSSKGLHFTWKSVK